MTLVEISFVLFAISTVLPSILLISSVRLLSFFKVVMFAIAWALVATSAVLFAIVSALVATSDPIPSMFSICQRNLEFL
jgi:hypothetical protein